MSVGASKEWFTTDDLVKYGGLPSKHMVAYLCRSAILSPSLNKTHGRGIARRFSYADLLLARAVSVLLRSGVSVQSLKTVLKTLRTKLGENPAQALSKKHVAIVGKQVYLLPSARSAIELTANGQLAFHFVLDIKDMVPAASLLVDSKSQVARRA